MHKYTNTQIHLGSSGTTRDSDGLLLNKEQLDEIKAFGRVRFFCNGIVIRDSWARNLCVATWKPSTTDSPGPGQRVREGFERIN